MPDITAGLIVAGNQRIDVETLRRGCDQQRTACGDFWQINAILL
jgi:hypothetical protein